jgi:hypothetical protein
MQCPSCAHLNAAMSVRCLQCGTTLIHEAEGSSPVAKRASHDLDSRLLGGVGASLGFFLTAIALKFVFTSLWLSDKEIYMFSVGGAILGAVVAKLYIRAKAHGL